LLCLSIFVYRYHCGIQEKLSWNKTLIVFHDLISILEITLCLCINYCNILPNPEQSFLRKICIKKSIKRNQKHFKIKNFKILCYDISIYCLKFIMSNYTNLNYLLLIISIGHQCVINLIKTIVKWFNLRNILNLKFSSLFFKCIY